MKRRKRGDGQSSDAMKSLELERLWNWLPTFRVVAEYENVQEAARMLRMSASSISRTIRLLELELGGPLFERRRGRLRINPAGTELLEAVRRSMRLVDDGVTSVRGLDGRGPFRISAPRDVVNAIVLPVLARTHAADPTATTFIRHDADARSVAAGVVDVALVYRPAPSPDVEVHRLGPIGFSVYCGRHHPLWGTTRVTRPAELLPFGFITNGEDPAWPVELPRTVVLATHDGGIAVAACASAIGLAVLPDVLAKDAVSAGHLRPLPNVELPASDLYALRRPSLARDRVTAFIEKLGQSLAAL